ncbi:MAG: cupin domain-containing protein [Ferruginibacter sp.]
MDIQLSEIESREITKGFRAKYIHSESMTLAFLEVSAGSMMPVHQHVHEQISQVVEGKFELTINGERKVYEPGVVVVIPSNTPHGGMAITDCKLLDIFSPVREDYR